MSPLSSRRFQLAFGLLLSASIAFNTAAAAERHLSPRARRVYNTIRAGAWIGLPLAMSAAGWLIGHAVTPELHLTPYAEIAKDLGPALQQHAAAVAHGPVDPVTIVGVDHVIHGNLTGIEYDFDRIKDLPHDQAIEEMTRLVNKEERSDNALARVVGAAFGGFSGLMTNVIVWTETKASSTAKRFAERVVGDLPH